MIKKLIDLKLPPGMYGNGPEYQAKNRCLEGRYVRFINNTIQPIGGWQALTASSGSVIGPLSGGCFRSSYAYRSTGGATGLIIGSTTKARVVTAGALTEITPLAGFTTGTCTGSFSDGTGVYGAGNYGDGPYGGLSLSSTQLDTDTWSFDAFGNYLVAVLTSDGKLRSWDGDTANNLDVITNAPTSNRACVVTPERILVALGAGGDGRKVQWSDQEDFTIWTPLATNTAGDFLLATSGILITGRRSRRQTLLWTDVDMWTMTYIGGEFIYSSDQAGDNCGVIGPNAVAMAGTKAFWMGKKGFYEFDGFVRPLPCEVADRIFADINTVQRAAVSAVTTSEYDEIWWFYPSSTSQENDSYVVYNYRENHWTTGTIARATGVDRGAMPAPIWVDPSGNVYEHEKIGGTHDAAPYITSGPLEIGDGDEVARIQRVVPDENTAGSVTLIFRKRMYPMDTLTLSGTYSLVNGGAVSVRETSRQFQMTFTGTAGADWRVGTFRFAIRPQGKR